MLHGNSGDGEQFTAKSSGWRKLGEDENIITVFLPAAYCINDNGEIKPITNGIRPWCRFYFFALARHPQWYQILTTIINELKI